MTTSATERGQHAASTAADESRNVAGTAKDEIQNVASVTADQARNLVQNAMDQVTSQVGEQTTTQRDRLASTLLSVSDDLDKMTEDSEAGLAGDLAQEVAQRARSLASHLEGREPAQLLDDVRDFARRRPAVFLLGALTAGVLAGRLVRGATDGVAAAALADEGRETAPAADAAQAGAGVEAVSLPPAAPPTASAPTLEAAGAVLDESDPMGTPAAGYGERHGGGDQA
jgi:hypothetical protein